jgi:hypothetical protein
MSEAEKPEDLTKSGQPLPKQLSTRQVVKPHVLMLKF